MMDRRLNKDRLINYDTNASKREQLANKVKHKAMNDDYQKINQSPNNSHYNLSLRKTKVH